VHKKKANWENRIRPHAVSPKVPDGFLLNLVLASALKFAKEEYNPCMTS
jgi:hypothetical protein